MNNLTSSDVIVFVTAGLLIILLLFAFIIFFVVSFRQQQRNYNILQGQKQEIEAQKIVLQDTLNDLQAAQSQLIQSEKMASLGALTAGVAHEIQNPLNFVTNFSEVSKDLLNEMQQEIGLGNMEEVKMIAMDVIDNLEKIYQHGKRADSIVKGMLQHSRKSTGEKELIDLNGLAEDFLKLSYHGMRAKDKSFNADFRTEFDLELPKVNVVPQDIGRVLLNLINNAFYACAQRANAGAADYKPCVLLSSRRHENQVQLSVADNGSGIPDSIKDKIFQPFFTTKPAGQGTGLGLSLSYDIVKAHGGELNVKSQPGETIFELCLMYTRDDK